MRKILLSCLLVGIMAMPALAGLNYPDIDVKGDLSFKSITADKYYSSTGTVLGKVDYVQLVADMSLSAELADNVGLKAVLRNASTQSGGNNADLNAVLSQTTVHNVYLDVKDIAGVDAVIGRQNIGAKKNALVFQSSKADAIKLSKKCGPVDITYISANGPEKSDTLNAIMLGGKIGPVDAGLTRYTQEFPTTYSANEVLDITVSGKIPVGCGIDASVEYAMQSGKKPTGGDEKDATAMLVKLGCGGCDMAVGKVTCGLTYLNTSGDKVGSDSKNYTGVNPSLKLTEIMSDISAGQKNDNLAYNNSADTIANLNVIFVNVGLAPAAVDGLTLGVAYGTYKRNEKVNNETELATEINLTANYKASDAVSLSLLLAQMDPGKAMTSGTDKATKIQAGMKIGF